MNSLGFVDWSSVNARFCGLMWLVVMALAFLIIVHLGMHAAPAHHAASGQLRLPLAH